MGLVFKSAPFSAGEEGEASMKTATRNGAAS